MRINYLYICAVILIVSCAPKFHPANRVFNEVISFDLDKFDKYTFQLIKKDYCSNHPVFTNGKDKTEDDLVFEELYLLLEKNGNRALYLTTFSHKYIYKGGVFNNKCLQDKISVNQIDFIFVGNYNNEKITFENLKHENVDKIDLYYTKINNNIKLEKITNNYGLKKDRDTIPFVDMDSVFAIDIVYQKDMREFIYQDINQEDIKVESLSINCKDLFFGLAENKREKYRFLKDRIGNDYTK